MKHLWLNELKSRGIRPTLLACLGAELIYNYGSQKFFMATATEKIETLNAELREAVTQYNQTIEAQAVLREKIIATQGAIGALQEFAKDETLNRLKEVEE